jgi:formylglycine-generating enzyme
MKKLILFVFLAAFSFCLAAQNNGIERAGLADVKNTRNPPTNVSIYCTETTVQLSWDTVPGASSYKVYSSVLPDADFSEDLTGGFLGTIWSAPLAGEKRFYYITAIKSIPAGFVFVEAGTIYPPDGDFTAGLTVSSSFYIAKYETTTAVWNAVMGGGSGDNMPKVYVSWMQVIEYCNLRSMQEGLTPCFSYLTYGTNPANWPAGWKNLEANRMNISCNFNTDGYRLPTDIEWEYAGRGGQETQGYVYAGSDDILVVGWCYTNCPYHDHGMLVGLLAPNELGTYDMSGNQHEWCWDAVTLYGVNWNTRLRGGGWNGGDWGCAMWHRYTSNPVGTGNYIGFRLCRSILQW